MTTTTLLFLHAGVVGLLWIIIAIWLAYRQLFHWLSVGFWSWVAFGLYFVINPAFVALTSENLDRYEVRLAIAGGADRALWILLVVLLGLVSFFWAYGHTTEPKASQWRLTQQITFPGVVVLSIVLVFSLYSLVAFRTFRDVQVVLIESSRFVGDVTGYQYSGYKFLFMPVALLLISRKRYLQIIGWSLLTLFLILSLPHGSARYTIVSLLILGSVAVVRLQQRRWPSSIWIAALVSIAAILQVRGHVAWSYQDAGRFLRQSTIESTQNFDEILAARDSAMLATFYLESYLHDTLIGYEYGIPLVNYGLLGWIPGRLFPQKYFLIDWLEDKQPLAPLQIQNLLYGGKSTILGDLYRNGGLIGVLMGAFILGRLGRKLDGWLDNNSHPMIQAVGIAFLAQLWMVWGSSVPWGLIRLGYALMPALLVWAIWQFDPIQKRNKNHTFQKAYFSHPFSQD